MWDAAGPADSDDFARAVRAGLAQRQKVIPARYFYDDAGSRLFEDITRLPEYYPTRTETGIMRDCAAEIAAAVGPGRVVVEFGSGSSAKTPLLLDAVQPAAYVPVDISGDFLAESAAALAAHFPELPILPVAADFTQPFALPDVAGDRLGWFPGSTIGNMGPMAAVDLLRSFAATLGAGSWLLIGLDLAKDRAVLEAAYNDAQGVTAAFNLNLLTRINRELGGTIDVAAFAHEARWCPELSRIEMHLVAMRATSFTAAGASFEMAAGESIHTENSYKWSLPESRLLARAAGWMPVAGWEDAAGWFSVQLWALPEQALSP
jgi:dimethylhistidine N-methyltransferase